MTEENIILPTGLFLFGIVYLNVSSLLQLLILLKIVLSNSGQIKKYYCKNSNTIRMILTKSRGPVKVLRIIHVN